MSLPNTAVEQLQAELLVCVPGQTVKGRKRELQEMGREALALPKMELSDLLYVTNPYLSNLALLFVYLFYTFINVILVDQCVKKYSDFQYQVRSVSNRNENLG